MAHIIHQVYCPMENKFGKIMHGLQHSIPIRGLCMSVCPTIMEPNQAEFMHQICSFFIQIRRVQIFSTKIRQTVEL